MKHISRTASLWALQPYTPASASRDAPRRRSLACPEDRGLFVRPIKQSFVRNARLMPGTRIALTLLAGWAGQGGPIETTTSILARHLGRSRRQAFRYLQDAAGEGYLRYAKTKDRIGRYTGIRIWLNFKAICHQRRSRDKHIHPKSPDSLAVTLTTETKPTDSYFLKGDPEFDRRIAEICRRNGFDPPSSC
jgi:hypothetical protein